MQWLVSISYVSKYVSKYSILYIPIYTVYSIHVYRTCTPDASPERIVRQSAERRAPERRAHCTMSLADKVAKLRDFFGVKRDVPLMQAVEAMHAHMGSVAEGPLP